MGNKSSSRYQAISSSPANRSPSRTTAEELDFLNPSTSTPDRDFKFEANGSGSVDISDGNGKLGAHQYSCTSRNSKGEPDGYHRLLCTELSKEGSPEEMRNGISQLKVHKLHISVVDFQSAWERIVPILMEHDLFEFKVRIANPTNQQKKHQVGKSIVLYYFNARDDFPWKTVLGKIETALAKKPKILPGVNPHYRFVGKDTDEKDESASEPKLLGSQYIYVSRDDIRDLNHLNSLTPIDRLGPVFSQINLDTETKPDSAP